MTDDVNGGGFLNQGYKAPDELEMFTEELFPVTGMVRVWGLPHWYVESRNWRSKWKFEMDCFMGELKIKYIKMEIWNELFMDEFENQISYYIAIHRDGIFNSSILPSGAVS